jgi:hypothetical protein
MAARNTGTTAASGTVRGYFAIIIDKKISIGYSSAQKRFLCCWALTGAISIND